jgi:hypothetical protein
MNTLKMLRRLDGDDLLEAIGLQRKNALDWVAPAMTALGVGILVGAGLGLLLAPKSGREIREDLRNRLAGEGDDDAHSSVSGTSSNSREPALRGA